MYFSSWIYRREVCEDLVVYPASQVYLKFEMIKMILLPTTGLEQAVCSVELDVSRVIGSLAGLAKIPRLTRCTGVDAGKLAGMRSLKTFVGYDVPFVD
jgi:hypothetical protein